MRELERSRRNWKIICDDFAAMIEPWPACRRAYFGKLAMLSLLTFRPFEAARYALRVRA